MKDRVVQVSGFPWVDDTNSGYLLVGVTESGDVVMSTGDKKWASVGPEYPSETGISMKDAELVIRFNELKETAGCCGITLLAEGQYFVFKDVPNTSGIVQFSTLSDVETFVYGYERGYKSG